MYCSPVIYNEDGLERLKQGGWDHIITDPDYENQPPVAPYRAHCKGNILIFCDARKRPEDSGEPDEVLFWQKPMCTKWSTKRCNRFIEEILVYKGKPPVFNPIHWSSMTGIFNDSFVSDKPDHPYAKPLSMLEKLVLMYTKPGELVFDPFCGSGTTGIAAKKHGRRFIGCEIDKNFYKIAEAAYRSA